MKITGKVVTKIYYNEENGYTVMVLKQSSSSVTVVGETFDIDVGDEVELEGVYCSHKDYGEQFKFTTCTKVMPKDEASIIQYIANNIKGIGKKIAKNIVNTFKEETIDVIRFSKEKLLEVQGMNEEKVESVHEFFTNEWEKWNSVQYLSTFGISTLTASKIYDVLKQNTINVVKEDPYSLLTFVKSLDFKLIDEIGLKEGIPKDSPSRMRTGILYYLNISSEFGHTYVEYDTLVKLAKEKLEVDDDIVEASLISLKMSEDIFIEDVGNKKAIFRKALYIAEQNIAMHVAEHSKKIMPKENFNKHLKEVTKNLGITLSEMQKQATIMALSKSISVITGGPRYRKNYNNTLHNRCFK